MGTHTGKVIRDASCNGFFGNRKDLRGAVVEASGKDWIVLRLVDEDVATADAGIYDLDVLVRNWTKTKK